MKYHLYWVKFQTINFKIHVIIFNKSYIWQHLNIDNFKILLKFVVFNNVNNTNVKNILLHKYDIYIFSFKFLLLHNFLIFL